MTDLQKATEDTMDKANILFSALMTLADSPREAGMILSIIYGLLWINGKSENGNLNTALDGFCDIVKLNVDRYEATKQ